jgi:thiol-disulfide isomerase/thioredoxin
LRATAGLLLLASLCLQIRAQSVDDVRGNGGELIARARGKIQVMVFVRTDCPIANRYAPLLQEMQKSYGTNVQFRLVFPDRNESAEKIREYLRDYHYESPALRDVNHALVKIVGAKVTPEVAVFDAQGALLYHGRIDNLYEHLGQARHAATTHELAEALEAARKGVRPAVSNVDAVGCYISDMQ